MQSALVATPGRYGRASYDVRNQRMPSFDTDIHVNCYMRTATASGSNDRGEYDAIPDAGTDGQLSNN